MISKKRVTAFLFIIMVLSVLSGVKTGEADSQEVTFLGGAGTSSDPYIIENVSDLQAINKDLTGHYILKNDIEASETITWNLGDGFIPIGTETNPFTGYFDGKNHTITGLYIKRQAMNNTGLFGNTGTGALVTSVHLVDSYILGRKGVGGIVGWNNLGVMSNCSVRGQIIGGQHTGGLVGWNGGLVSNCYFKGNISEAGGFLVSLFGGLIGINSGTVTNSYALVNVTGNQIIGGLIGLNSESVSNCYTYVNVSGSQSIGGLIGENNGQVSNCHTTGSVKGSSSIGGLLGKNYDKVSNCMASVETIGDFGYYFGGLVGLNYARVSNCIATGNISGQNGVAGLVGYNKGIISGCYASGNTNGTGQHIGGLVGYNFEGTISNCYSTGNVIGNKSIGGLIGWNNGIVSNSHYDIDEVLINGCNQLTVGGLYGNQYLDWISNDLTLKISDYSYTLIPSDNYYKISNVQGLKDLLGFADVERYRYRLISDIDLSSNSGLYIPYFGSLEFDGNNHKISNMDLDLDFVSNIGMIGCNQGGSIRNIRVNGYIAGEENVGGLVGYNLGMMSNCVTNVNIGGSSSIGGLIGYNSHATISNCRSSGNVEGHEWVGGLVGENYCTLSNCHAMGSVNGSRSVGGLVGNNHGPVSNCYATGSIFGHRLIGGLLGSNSNEVFNCYAMGSIIGSSTLGGLIGQNQGTVSYCNATGSVKGDRGIGGFIGTNHNEVSGCYSTGSVYGNSLCGGLLGVNNGVVSNCYAIGNTTRMGGSNVELGGFVGRTSNYCKIVNCYSTGMVEYQGIANPADKGFAGSVSTGDYFDMRGNFWDSQKSLQTTTSGNATGKNTSMMKTKITFSRAGWDFGNVWCMIEKVTYPFLRWQDTGPPNAITGPNVTIDEGTIIEFNGSKSSDDTGIANYTWTFIDETPVTLYGVNPVYQFDNPGRFVITLNVDDAVGLRGTDTMDVTVLDITPPIADAGQDITIDEGCLITFNGSSCSDNVKIINYTWTFIDGDLITLYGIWPIYRFNNPGEYIVTLTINDTAGNLGTDTMTIRVNDITPPIADAGQDRIVDQGESVTFNGDKSSDNMGIINYTWLFEYETVEIVLYGISPSFIFEIPGMYSVRLKVTDATGRWNDDDINVTVNDISPPVADAGEDQVVPVETNIVLSGSSSSDNVAVVNYIWTFYYSGNEQTLEGEKASFTFNIGGSYEIVLKVADPSGNLDEDILNITIIDTGKVTGILFDKDGNTVKGATVFINASDGEIHTMETGSDGSFSFEIWYGSFTWRISKEGYETIYGNSSVKAMSETNMDLSIKSIQERASEKSKIPIVVGVTILMLAILGFALFIVLSKRRESERFPFHKKEETDEFMYDPLEKE
jgi:hypothetical protein